MSDRTTDCRLLDGFRLRRAGSHRVLDVAPDEVGGERRILPLGGMGDVAGDAEQACPREEIDRLHAVVLTERAAQLRRQVRQQVGSPEASVMAPMIPPRHPQRMHAAIGSP